VLTVTLNRPEVHNAFNEELIAEAIDLFAAAAPSTARVVVLRGTGPNFCAGADLNWMTRMVSYTRDENVRDSSQLARMYAMINECPLPSSAGSRERPSARCRPGGRLRYRHRRARCEVRFVRGQARHPPRSSRHMSSQDCRDHARALFLTGERFDAERALRSVYVHRVVDDVDAAVAESINQLRNVRPEAVRECKKLIAYVASHDLIDAISLHHRAIARVVSAKKDRAGWSVSEKGENGRVEVVIPSPSHPNRGEIAVRIARACREAGIESILGYSEADDIRYVRRYFDDAVPSAAERRGRRISTSHGHRRRAARGADAIHPATGSFPSAPSWPAACDDAGIVSSDRRPARSRRWRSKAKSRHLMQRLGVPVVPGLTTARGKHRSFTAEAARIGVSSAGESQLRRGGKG